MTYETLNFSFPDFSHSFFLLPDARNFEGLNMYYANPACYDAVEKQGGVGNYMWYGANSSQNPANKGANNSTSGNNSMGGRGANNGQNNAGGIGGFGAFGFAGASKDKNGRGKA